MSDFEGEFGGFGKFVVGLVCVVICLILGACFGAQIEEKWPTYSGWTRGKLSVAQQDAASTVVEEPVTVYDAVEADGPYHKLNTNFQILSDRVKELQQEAYDTRDRLTKLENHAVSTAEFEFDMNNLKQMGDHETRLRKLEDKISFQEQLTAPKLDSEGEYIEELDTRLRSVEARPPFPPDLEQRVSDLERFTGIKRFDPIFDRYDVPEPPPPFEEYRGQWYQRIPVGPFPYYNGRTNGVIDSKGKTRLIPHGYMSDRLIQELEEMPEGTTLKLPQGHFDVKDPQIRVYKPKQSVQDDVPDAPPPVDRDASEAFRSYNIPLHRIIPRSRGLFNRFNTPFKTWDD